MKLRLLAMCALFLAAALPACAFTPVDADTAVNSYFKAFVRPNGVGTFIQGDQKGGDPGFWQEIEEIEGIEDANDRTGGAYKTQVASLLIGFFETHGVLWSDNKFNDDIAWATIACVRGYQATGNRMFLVIAKANFDLMYARAWDPARGTLYWTTDNNTYNSCIECPAGIASFLLSQSLGNDEYRTKAQSLLTWEKANLFDASTGAVWDSVRKNGRVGTWSSSYNQGTFVGLANLLCDTATAKQAADYTKTHLGKQTGSGYLILPEYGAGGGNNAGLNSICLRWIARFMKDRALQSDYLGWLQANANAAWNVRRPSDDLSWCQWLQPTPEGNLHSWDCLSSLVALQVTPPDEAASK